MDVTSPNSGDGHSAQDHSHGPATAEEHRWQRLWIGVTSILIPLCVLLAALAADRSLSRVLREDALENARAMAYGISRTLAGHWPNAKRDDAHASDADLLRVWEAQIAPHAVRFGLQSIRLVPGATEPALSPADFAARAVIYEPHSTGVQGFVVCFADPAGWKMRRNHLRVWLLAATVAVIAAWVFALWIRMRRDRGGGAVPALPQQTETWAAAVCAIAVALLINRIAAEQDRRRQNDRWDGFRTRAVVAVEDLFRTTELFLESLALFFEGSDTVTAGEFKVFAEPLSVQLGADGVAWLPRVPSADAVAFETEARETGSPSLDGAVWGATADSDTDRYPILYQVGRIPDMVADGDADVEPALRDALRESRRRHVAIAAPSPPADAVDPRPLLRVFYPVRKPLSAQGWRWSSDGVLCLRIPLDLWSERVEIPSAAGERLLKVWIEEAATGEIWASRAPPQASRDPVMALGRLWLISTLPQPAFHQEYGGGTPWRRYLTSALMVVTVSLGANRVRNRSARLESAVAARTADLRNREAELEASERRYRQLFTEMDDGFALHEMVFDGVGQPCDSRFLEVNPAFERLTGLRADAVIGRTALEILPDIEPIWIERCGNVVQTGQPFRFEYYAVAMQRHFEVHAYRPAPGRFATIFRDVTLPKKVEQERLQIERRLMQSQRLESLGVLAGGVAHDFNNLLMAILGNAELGAHHVTQPAVVADHLSEIAIAARRAADLCRQMLAYAGKGRVAVGPVDINIQIEEMLHLLQATISRRAVLNLRLESGLPRVLGDASQIRQVIMNLVLNASEALEEKSGTISISSGRIPCDRAFLDRTLFAADAVEGDFVWIEVADTGRGMDAATMSRVFDPFFTTKFAGRGLGLSTVMGIVRGHRGALQVYSEPGRGTVFKVYFPVAAEPVRESSGSERPDRTPWRGSGTALLADDEPSVRAIGAALLESLGFNCVAVSDGLEAVEALRRDPRGYALAIVDLTMPGLGGELTLRRLREIRADLPVYLASGYSVEELEVRLSVKGFSGVIQKPYSSKELQHLLSRAPPGAAGFSSADESKSTAPDAPV